MIRKAIILIFMAILGLTYTLQAKDDRISKFFEKYSKVDGVTYVNFTPTPAFMEGASEEMKDKESADLIKNLNSVKILTTKKKGDREKQEKAKVQNLDNIYQDALKTLPLDEFEKFLEVREGKKEVMVYIKNSKDKAKAKEILIMVKEGDDLNIIWIEGLIALKDISKLSKMMEK